MKRVLLLVATALFLVACAGEREAGFEFEPAPPPIGEPAPPREARPPLPNAPPEPPPIVLINGDRETEFTPFTFCWTSGNEGICADGEPTRPAQSIGAGESFLIEYPIDGWDFSVSTESGCATTSFVVEQVDATTWEVMASGEPGLSELTVSGFGPQGDVHVAVGFEAETSEQLNVAFGAQIFSFVERGDEISFEGVEVSINGLAAPARKSLAWLTLEGADGAAQTFELERADEGEDCSVIFVLPEVLDQAAIDALGGTPIMHRIELFIDGNLWLSEASWPDDVIGPEIPAMSLTLEEVDELPSMG